MRRAALFMRIIGGFYLLNLALLWPGLWAVQLPSMYRGVELHTGEPVFELLLNAWLAVGLGLAAIGSVLLWAARDPLGNRSLILVVIATEVLFSGWDIYSALYGHQVLMVAAITLVIHLLIIVWGIFAVRSPTALSEA